MERLLMLLSFYGGPILTYFSIVDDDSDDGDDRGLIHWSLLPTRTTANVEDTFAKFVLERIGYG